MCVYESGSGWQIDIALAERHRRGGQRDGLAHAPPIVPPMPVEGACVGFGTAAPSLPAIAVVVAATVVAAGDFPAAVVVVFEGSKVAGVAVPVVAAVVVDVDDVVANVAVVVVVVAVAFVVVVMVVVVAVVHATCIISCVLSTRLFLQLQPPRALHDSTSVRCCANPVPHPLLMMTQSFGKV